MKVTLSTVSGDVFVLDVAADIELENLKALAEFEVGIPASDMVVLHEMRPLEADKRAISELGVNDGDILLVQRRTAAAATPAATAALDSPAGADGAGGAAAAAGGMNASNPAALRDMLLSNPAQLAMLRHNNPRLADALEAGLDQFTTVLGELQKERAERELHKLKMLTADPFDPETQRLIAEHIRQQNVDANMEAAMEHHPEAFGVVTMLYINCRVNGHPVKAFVDSGAQSTIMSQKCAERCGIMRLVDPRWAGVAKGVGTQKIIGRIHLVQIEIEKDFLATNFAVLEDQPMDMLLGLDMLKRHQCLIDLRRNCLLIGTTGTETTFLPESELPECGRLNDAPAEPMDEDKELQKAIENSRKDAPGGSSSSDAGPSAKKQATGNGGGAAGSGGGGGGSSSSSSSSSSAATNNHPPHPQEKVVAEIVALGFKRDDAIRELDRAKGDKNQAIGALFAKSFTLPK